MPRWSSALVAACAVVSFVRVAEAAPFAGTVLDGMTLKPIRGATIAAPDGTATRSDRNGAFRIDDLPPGPIDLRVTADGYEETVETVEIAEGGVLDHVFILFTPGAAGEIIEIEEEAPVPPPPGRQDLGRKEIQRIPGTRGDALTAVRSLPGVGQAQAAGAGPGQIVIRGSAPEDSKVTFDGIEVPVLYHFFGVQSVLPTEFIDNIEFLPGGFGAEEGRATGGVVNVVTRAEAISEPEGFAELSFINVAGFFQTPVSEKHGVQVSGALRRSIIDFVLPAVIPDDANLAFTTAPQYYDGQLRVDWRRSETDRVSVLGLVSFDLLSLLSENLDPNEPDFRGKFDNETTFNRVIATWQRGKDGRTNRLSLAAGSSGFRLEIGTDRYLKFGQTVVEARDDAAWKVNRGLTVRAGAEARWDQRDLRTRFPAPPAEGMPPTNFSSAPLVTVDRVVNNDVAAVYLATDIRPVPTLTITPGLRGDYFAFLDDLTVSPRLQVTQRVGEQWTARLAMGRYTRGLEGPESIDPDLVPEEAFHYVLGASVEPRDGIKGEASLFYNDKRRLVTVDPTQAATMPLTAYLNRAYGSSYGGEVLVRAKLEKFFGWLAYSYNVSERIDAPDLMERLFDYDQTHNVVLVGSYQLGRWQIGGRWQYATGTPYTPVVDSLYLSDANAFIPVYGTVNSERIEAAHSLDLRVDRAWKFQDWELSAYLDVTNVYAHARTLGYQYNYDFTEKQAITELPIVPALGVRGSF